MFQQDSSWMEQISMSNQAMDSIQHQVTAYKQQFGASPEHDGVALMMSPQTYKAIQHDYPHVDPYPFGKIFGMKVYQEHGMKPGEVFMVLTKGLPYTQPAPDWSQYKPPGIYAIAQPGPQIQVAKPTITISYDLKADTYLLYEDGVHAHTWTGQYLDTVFNQGVKLAPYLPFSTRQKIEKCWKANHPFAAQYVEPAYPEGLEFVKDPQGSASGYLPQVIYEAAGQHYVLIDSNLKEWKLAKEFMKVYDGPKPPVQGISTEGWKVVVDFHHTMEMTPKPVSDISVTHTASSDIYTVIWSNTEGYTLQGDLVKDIIEGKKSIPGDLPMHAWQKVVQHWTKVQEGEEIVSAAGTIKFGSWQIGTGKYSVSPEPQTLTNKSMGNPFEGKPKKKAKGSSVVYNGNDTFILYEDGKLVYKFTKSYVQHKIDVDHTSSKCTDAQWNYVLKAYEKQMKAQANIEKALAPTIMSDSNLKLKLVKDAVGHYQVCTCDTSPVDCKTHNPDPKVTMKDLQKAVGDIMTTGDGEKIVKGDIDISNVFSGSGLTTLTWNGQKIQLGEPVETIKEVKGVYEHDLEELSIEDDPYDNDDPYDDEEEPF